MNIELDLGYIEIDVYQHTEDHRPEISIYVDYGSVSRTRIPIHENHAQALILALQAAVAEVQARAVSR